MGLTGVLEALIGLVFIYFIASVLCSTLNELIAQELGRRGKFLREGLMNIVSDRWIYLRLINQPLVSALYRDVPGKPKTPSYMPSLTFADGLLDTILLKARQIDPALAPAGNAAPTLEDIRGAALKCKQYGYSVGDAILPLIDAAKGDLETARKNIAAWYDSGMERVTGWYKKHTRRLLLVIGLAVAVLFNIDTFQIVSELSRSSSLRKSLADTAVQTVETKKFQGVPLQVDESDVRIAQADLKKFVENITALERQGLPIGFSCLSLEKVTVQDIRLVQTIRDCWDLTKQQTGSAWIMKMLGWILSALAISFGAPFWFDLLNKLADLRGAGKKAEPAKADTK